MTRIIKDFNFENLEFQFDYRFDGSDWDIDVTGNTDAAQEALNDDEFFDRVYAYVNKTWFSDNKNYVEA